MLSGNPTIRQTFDRLRGGQLARQPRPSLGLFACLTRRTTSGDAHDCDFEHSMATGAVARTFWSSTDLPLPLRWPSVFFVCGKSLGMRLQRAGGQTKRHDRARATAPCLPGGYLLSRLANRWLHPSQSIALPKEGPTAVRCWPFLQVRPADL